MSTWLTRPDGTSQALTGGRASGQGEFDLTVDTSGLAAGTYVVAAYGQHSEEYGSGLLEVGASDNQVKPSDSLRLKSLGDKEKAVNTITKWVPNFQG